MQQIINSFDFLIPIFLFMVFVVMIIIIGYGIYKSKKGEQIIWSKCISKIAFVFIILGIIAVTCMPSSVRHFQPRSLSLIPFYDYFKPSLNGNNLLSIYFLNTILFIPLGFVLGMVFKTKKTYQITLYGFFLSLCIETIQFVLPLGRTTTIDDLIFNTLGTAIGVLLYKVICKIFYSHNIL